MKQICAVPDLRKVGLILAICKPEARETPESSADYIQVTVETL